MNVKGLFGLSACILWCGVVGAERFVQRPGVEEFTGMLIARPLPWAQAVSYAGTAGAKELRDDAKRFLAMRAMHSYPEVEEYILPIPKGWNENTYSEWLMNTGLVEYANPNWRLCPAIRPDDPSYPYQWHHTTLQSELAWNVTTGDTSIIIAVVDSGADATNPDLTLVAGYRYVNGVGGGSTNDIFGHGTEVAGVVGAKGNNGIGVCGVGWGFTVRPVRVSNDSTAGAALLSDILEGARWAAESDHSSVVNVSYEGVDNASVQTTGSYIRSLDALLVWSAGNQNAQVTNDWADVVIVGATDQSNNRWSSSNYGAGIDVTAPGTNILTLKKGGGTITVSGTSLAAPVISGQLAMLLSANPGLTFTEIAEATTGIEGNLIHSCLDLGTAGRDWDFGWGRADSYEAAKRCVQFLLHDFGANTEAIAVSSNGMVAGNYLSGPMRAFLWDGSTMVTLPRLYGSSTVSKVLGQNDSSPGNPYYYLTGYCVNGPTDSPMNRVPCRWTVSGVSPADHRLRRLRMGNRGSAGQLCVRQLPGERDKLGHESSVLAELWTSRGASTPYTVHSMLRVQHRHRQEHHRLFDERRV